MGYERWEMGYSVEDGGDRSSFKRRVCDRSISPSKTMWIVVFIGKWSVIWLLCLWSALTMANVLICLLATSSRATLPKCFYPFPLFLFSRRLKDSFSLLFSFLAVILLLLLLSEFSGSFSNTVVLLIQIIYIKIKACLNTYVNHSLIIQSTSLALQFNNKKMFFIALFWENCCKYMYKCNQTLYIFF